MDLIQRLRAAAQNSDHPPTFGLLLEAAAELDAIRELVMPGALHRQHVAQVFGLSTAADLADLNKIDTAKLLRDNLVASAS